ncbi:MAG: COX15/CtaA family protein [Pseudomonadota bacterium]|uniref:COX15/CtaA family protein n=1 Tax=unclassified Phenylobacterium TaxID=2640670 RepID=UPI0006F6A333|nr:MULTISPECIES: COX15/CtaA family protein [unclassified Phenylobacterium]KRB44379.1 heme A synthase [Phenylobacterium sp. Root700]MBT9472414.1 COX15/CtaA family protein [Phenylobacterium sp.]
MTSFLRSDRSRPVAVWLFVVAALVLAMIVVGGATRLTDSGLSITEWKPVTGALPPMSAKDWNDEFALYKEIPQYAQLNQGMSLDQFKTIYWWEWSHRLLGRLVGAAFALPFAYFLIRRELPKRLIVRCVGLFALGGLQGAVGWWMVASGLSDRVSVAPERLTVHLGLAFTLLGALVWTALDAWNGAPRQTVPSPWSRRALALVGLIFLQILLGALVAGNDAGLVYNDWPLMNGALLPQEYAGANLWATIAHSQGAVQLHHRLVAYLLTVVGIAAAWGASRSRYLPFDAKVLAVTVGGAIVLQAILGVITLVFGVPIWLGMAHQIVAAIVLSLAVAFAWRARRP